MTPDKGRILAVDRLITAARDELRSVRSVVRMDGVKREQAAWAAEELIVAQDALRRAGVLMRLVAKDFSPIITDPDTPEFDAAVERTRPHD